MPQRRSFAPLPMNEAHVNAHGHTAAPPNLQPAPQPLPPMASAVPPPQAEAGAGAAPGQPGQPARPPLPASIPLQPMQGAPGMPSTPGAMPGAPPAGPVRQPMPTPGAGIGPANADQFTQPEIGGDMLPGAGGGGDHAALLKLLGALGHTAGG